MHKNIPVVDMEIDEATGYISKIRDVHDPRRIPIGVNILKSGVDRKALNDWWLSRSIPASRVGLLDALVGIGISSPALLLEKCYGLSLSDQYWICPKDSGLAWEDVNFFHNDFSKDMGEILFGHEPEGSENISLMSPDNTSDGWLRKKWVISCGKRLLMKGGSGYFQQEPYNEVIACALMRRLGIHHVEYMLTADDGKPYSLCETFVTPDTELIPAWRIIQTQKRPNNRSLLNHLLVCSEELGIPDVKGALNRMLAIDYIIANEDRHWNNFGFVRNANTLVWIGLAPVYDSGTSLWYDKRVGVRVESKPFLSDHAEQIKLVDDLGWFDSDSLKDIENEIHSIFSASEEVDQTRRNEIAKAVMERVGQIDLRRRGSAISFSYFPSS